MDSGLDSGLDSGSSEVQLVQELPLVHEGTPQTNEDDGSIKFQRN